MRNNKKNNFNNKKVIHSVVTVTAEECGDNAEKMIRKFTKKVKKEGIIEEYKARSRFIKPTTIRAEKKRAKKRLIQKAVRRENELIKTRDSFRRRRK